MKKLRISTIGSVCLLVLCGGTLLQFYGQASARPTEAKTINTIQYVQPGGDIQAAITSAGPGGRVIVEPGTYVLRSPLTPSNGAVIDCSGGQVLGRAGAVFKTVGHIWALENPNPSHSGINSVTIINCVFDLSGNPQAAGALNLRGIAFSKFYSVTIVMPATGQTEAVRFDGQDSTAKIPAYWNDFYSPNIYALGSGSQNGHIAFHFVNGGNDEHIFGGAIERVAKAFFLEGSDGSMVAGTGAEDFSQCIDLSGTAVDGPNHVSGNTFLNVRCESRMPTNLAIDISALSYNNQILFPHSFASLDASTHMRDLSKGQNTVAYSVKNEAVYTMGSLGDSLRFGVNKTASAPGIDVHGNLSADGHWRVGSGIDGNSPGFKTVRGNTCDTKPQDGATCIQRLNWKTPFQDNNYTATCSLASAHGKPYIVAINPDPSGLNIDIGSAANIVSGGLANCIGIHD